MLLVLNSFIPANLSFQLFFKLTMMNNKDLTKNSAINNIIKILCKKSSKRNNHNEI
jgi:hypothetical protein